jgi:hypothetical protein
MDDDLAAEHAPYCGTYLGYQQINRWRVRIRRTMPRGTPLPEYDAPCKEAWADFTKSKRQAEAAVRGPISRKSDAECGTYTRYRQHIRERAELRAAGVPDDDLPPIDAACQQADRRDRSGPDPEEQHAERLLDRVNRLELDRF